MDEKSSVRNTLMSFSDVSYDVNIKSGCCFKHARNKCILSDVKLVGLVYFAFIIVFAKHKLTIYSFFKTRKINMFCKYNCF